MEVITIILCIVCALSSFIAYTLHRKCHSIQKAQSAFEDRISQAESDSAKYTMEITRLNTINENLLEQNSMLSTELQRAREDIAATREKLNTTEVEKARAIERLEVLSAEQKRINAEAEERFKLLANDVLAQNSQALSAQSKSGLAEVLAPMKENLEQFKKNFIERYDKESRDRFSLENRIRELAEMNRTIGTETRRLTDALKGNSKLQGDWGEMILDNILDRAGFRRGDDYTVQETVSDETGARLRPDVVITYTKGRKIVIDSKVSIQDYLGMLDAPDEEHREKLAKAHVASVRKHIAELKGKSYQDYVGTGQVDFVMMFIPHEGAFLAAMNLDNTLWQTAYDSRVIIISPTHLVSIIKLVEQMWRHDEQNRNALEIAKQAGAMLDKLRGFVDDMDKIDKAINSARDSWNGAFNKLTSGSGNLIGRAERLRKLGAKAAKAIPERYTAAVELDDDITDVEAVDTSADELES